MKFTHHTFNLHPPDARRPLLDDWSCTVHWERGLGGYVSWYWRRRSHNISLTLVRDEEVKA